MDVKIFVIIGFSYLYGLFELILYLRQRGKSKVKTSGDKKSLWLLVILITIGFSLSFAIGATKIGRVQPWNAYFAVGAVLVVIGLVIRIQSILTLRRYFTYTVAQVEDHELIETGLYKSIRHPGYLGQLLIFAGLSISLSNWLSVLLMMIPVGFGYLYRMNVEERFMREQMGEKYLEYQKRTKRIIPKVY